MAWERDAGFFGTIESLAGIQGHGIEVEYFAPVTVVLPGADIRGANPRRIWMLIQNISAVRCEVGLGAGCNMMLYPGTTMQIDRLMPWTGPIRAMTETVDCTLACLEAQVTK